MTAISVYLEVRIQNFLPLSDNEGNIIVGGFCHVQAKTKSKKKQKAHIKRLGFVLFCFSKLKSSFKVLSKSKYF